MKLPKPKMLLLTPALLSILPFTFAAEEEVQYVTTYNEFDESIAVRDDRQPSLWTQKYGDCNGNPQIEVTRFDAAYYKDNMTVLFHLEGNTQLANDSLMMFIGVYAYGESRFNLTFDPCNAQIYSLCPLNRSVPISANGVIPVSQQDVAGIPPIALSIPDFEGQAILRLVSNSTQGELACYSAVVTNGVTFSHPSSVGTVLGLFSFVAVVASFATSVYGDHIPAMRTHYAHSLSVFVVFSVFHHIYYTGALSVHWPSNLVAWWHNFAWAGGMIYNQNMQNSINQLIGSNRGNISFVGAVSAGPDGDKIGGGYSLSSIYASTASTAEVIARSVPAGPSMEGIYRRWTNSVTNVDQLLRQRSLESFIAKRAEAQSSNTVDSPWYGQPAKPGLPVPGNFSGLAGTLSEEDIPASNAFMTGFLWVLILMAIIAVAIAVFKWVLEALSKKDWIKTERLDYFRTHWIKYILQAFLRIMFIAFFMLMYLAIFQFAFVGKGGATAIAALVFIVLLVGMGFLAGITCYERSRQGQWSLTPNRMHVERSWMMGVIPSLKFGLESNRNKKANPRPSLLSFALNAPRWIPTEENMLEVHQDEEFITRKGWLTARFRRTRWWFFAAWLSYELIRACFYGGAAGHPMIQVFGLLVVEILAFIIFVKLRPFEGARLNTLMVWLLSFSKILSVALSCAFAPRFHITRIIATAVGIIIIVIQGILTIVLLVFVIISAVSSYMSLTRNHKDFKPKKWAKIRERWFVHIEKATHDLPPPPKPEPEEPKAPYFDVKVVRRETKIEDEDGDIQNSIQDAHESQISVAQTGPSFTPTRASRANSIAPLDSPQNNLSYGAKGVPRASWSTRDFENFGGVDSARSSRHMSAAIGLHSSPHSRHASTYALPHLASNSSLRQHTQQPTTPAPLRDSETIIVRRSRPNTSTAMINREPHLAQNDRDDMSH